MLEKLHKLQPASRSVTAMLADADLQAGKLEEADALYQQLLARTPNDPVLLDARGQVLIRLQRYPKAIASFRKAVAVKAADVGCLVGDRFCGLRGAPVPGRAGRAFHAIKICGRESSKSVSVGNGVR